MWYKSHDGSIQAGGGICEELTECPYGAERKCSSECLKRSL